jgi:hypothetical protein
MMTAALMSLSLRVPIHSANLKVRGVPGTLFTGTLFKNGKTFVPNLFRYSGKEFLKKL